jgi:hypothetical protein
MVDALFTDRLSNPPLDPVDRQAADRCNLLAPIRQSDAHSAAIDRIDRPLDIATQHEGIEQLADRLFRYAQQATQFSG